MENIEKNVGRNNRYVTENSLKKSYSRKLFFFILKDLYSLRTFTKIGEEITF